MNRRYFAIALRAVAIVLLIVAAFRIAIAAMFAETKKAAWIFRLWAISHGRKDCSENSRQMQRWRPTEALLVLIDYQNQGYAVVSF